VRAAIGKDTATGGVGEVAVGVEARVVPEAEQGAKAGLVKVKGSLVLEVEREVAARVKPGALQALPGA
jgi:hypothetical protein